MFWGKTLQAPPTQILFDRKSLERTQDFVEPRGLPDSRIVIPAVIECVANALRHRFDDGFGASATVGNSRRRPCRELIDLGRPW